MKIYNQDKTKILDKEQLDLEKGYLVLDRKEITIPEVKYIPGEGHYEVIAEYPNGGKDLKWIVDKPEVLYVPEHTEMESIQVYIPYNDEELKERGLYEYSEQELLEQKKLEWEKHRLEKIQMYKQALLDSDYRAIKYAEGWYTEEEYAPWKEQREYYRTRVRFFEELELDVENNLDIEWNAI